MNFLILQLDYVRIPPRVQEYPYNTIYNYSSQIQDLKLIPKYNVLTPPPFQSICHPVFRFFVWCECAATLISNISNQSKIPFEKR